LALIEKTPSGLCGRTVFLFLPLLIKKIRVLARAACKLTVYCLNLVQKPEVMPAAFSSQYDSVDKKLAIYH
jgi:hypothetical protein